MPRKATAGAASRCSRLRIAFALIGAGCGPSLAGGTRADESTSADTEVGSTTVAASTASEATSSSTAAETSDTTTSGEGLGLPPGCECLEDFGCDCYDDFSACFSVTEPCEAPSPCPLVDETNPEAATCVLELLRDRTFARFSYCHLCGGYESYGGHFYILGADHGIDFECHSVDLSSTETIEYYGIETPEYFAACLVMEDFALRRDCLFGGFEPGEPVDSCR
jgi:hypothetical protein